MRAPVRAGLAAFVLLGVLGGAATPALAQCSMCKTLLTNSPEGRAMSAQFNVAILVMLVAPYLVFGSLALVVFGKRIRARIVRAVSPLALSRRLPRPLGPQPS